MHVAQQHSNFIPRYIFHTNSFACTINYNRIYRSLSAHLSRGYWLLSSVQGRTVDTAENMRMHSMQAQPVEEDTLLLGKLMSGILARHVDLSESALLLVMPASPLRTVVLPVNRTEGSTSERHIWSTHFPFPSL